MITQAAIKHNDQVHVGKNHGDIMYRMITERCFNYDKPAYTEGFVDDTGNFLTRREAAIEAFECGQILTKKLSLFSYDLEGK